MSKGNISLKGVADKIGGEIARRVSGCTPETEKDAERIMNTVYKYFGSKADAIQAIRFAGSLINESEAITNAASLLRDLSSAVNPSIVRQSATDFKNSMKKINNPKLKEEPMDVRELTELVNDALDRPNPIDESSLLTSRAKERYFGSIADSLRVDGFPELK